MQLHEVPSSVFRPQLPPLWYVTNGEVTVGPVVTSLLQRGVEYGRIPEYCKVRALSSHWRGLEAVREIAALSSKAAQVKVQTREAVDELGRAARRIRDEEQFCDKLTQMSIAITGAESGMFHYRGRSARTLYTRSVRGPMSRARFGLPLPESDPVLQTARRRHPVLGPPYGPVEDALSIRFATSYGGVGGAAMVPLFIGGQLTGMIELSRPGHAFRQADLRYAEALARIALLRRAN